MGSIPSELSLDYRRMPTAVATDVARGENLFQQTISKLVAEVSVIRHISENFSKVDDYAKKLEEETKKIDAFKRELPLCMLLLRDALGFLREELYKSNVKPVLEEFIPLKKNCYDEDEEEDDRGRTRKEDWIDKKNWLSSAQLWNSSDNTSSKSEMKKRLLEEDQGFPQSCRSHNTLRAFAPFKEFCNLPHVGLSLQTPGIEKLNEDVGFSSTSRGTLAFSSSINSAQRAVTPTQSQTARKQRRCWSPDLHRKFVDALQKLGGCQVATPKQIRELMQVDGLTNDEVKSHLQKYRLHTRKVPNSTNTPSSNQSAVVLGGLCMGQDECGESANRTSSPQCHLQLRGVSGGDSMEEDEEDDGNSENQRRYNSCTSTLKTKNV